MVPEGFKWVGLPVTVKGEDFSYEATCLCSFPKTNGKLRYIVEDNGRLFVQRREQLTFRTSTYMAESDIGIRSGAGYEVGLDFGVEHSSPRECQRCQGKGKFGDVECGSCGGTGIYQGVTRAQ